MLDVCCMIMDLPSTSSWLSELQDQMEEHQDFVNEHQQLISCANIDSRNYSNSQENLIKGFTNNYPVLNQSIEATATINGGILLGNHHQDYNHEIMKKKKKTSRFAPNNYHGSSSPNTNISFGNQLLTPPSTHTILFDAKENAVCSSNSRRRNYKEAQEHVFAEKKRREKLSQCFISLYALLPHHKKMDKATVLEDASEYIIQLQQRVKELEEKIQVKGKHIQISKLCGGIDFKEDTSELARSNLNSSSCTADIIDPAAEIVVRISGSNILVKIYCETSSSQLVFKVLMTEIERLRLAFISSNVVPYSSNIASLITITAQMSEEVLMTATDLVKYLQSALN